MTKPSRHEPGVNLTSEQMAQHFGVAGGAGTAAKAVRRSQVGARSAGGRALDPGRAAQTHLLLFWRVELGHRVLAERLQEAGQGTIAMNSGLPLLRRGMAPAEEGGFSGWLVVHFGVHFETDRAVSGQSTIDKKALFATSSTALRIRLLSSLLSSLLPKRLTRLYLEVTKQAGVIQW